MPSIYRTEKRGRGRPRTNPTSIHLTLAPDQLQALDGWIAKLREHRSRPEAIREILERALKHDQPRRAGPHRGASKATDMASKELDRLGDASATEEERRTRKRRILKGPREFREMREDFPKGKRAR